jgi:anti-anti-sigma factor
MDPVFEMIAVDARRFRLVGELDLDTVSVFNDAIEQSGSTPGMTLDLAELTFIDSCGLQALMAYATSLDGGGPLVLVNPTGAVAKVFDIVGLPRHPGIELRSAE